MVEGNIELKWLEQTKELWKLREFYEWIERYIEKRQEEKEMDDKEM